MVTDRQVRLLMKRIQTEKSLAVAAAKCGMSEKTARRYRDLGKLPGQVRPRHDWRTRPDPFEDVWEEVRGHLQQEPTLEARTLFDALQRQYPGRFADGQLRTLQRRVKTWRAAEGPPREVYFPQVHEPGRLCASDFTHMTSLGVTLAGRPFEHLIYHFVLTYSNWETGTICFSESFESLSEGLQNALWELGGVPAEHRTDRLTAAVHKTDHPEEFTQRYEAILRHYGLAGRKIQGGKAHENGDVEQSHHRFKRAVDQALLLRGRPAPAAGSAERSPTATGAIPRSRPSFRTRARPPSSASSLPPTSSAARASGPFAGSSRRWGSASAAGSPGTGAPCSTCSETPSTPASCAGAARSMTRRTRRSSRATCSSGRRRSSRNDPMSWSAASGATAASGS